MSIDRAFFFVTLAISAVKSDPWCRMKGTQQPGAVKALYRLRTDCTYRARKEVGIHASNVYMFNPRIACKPAEELYDLIGNPVGLNMDENVLNLVLRD